MTVNLPNTIVNVNKQGYNVFAYEVNVVAANVYIDHNFVDPAASGANVSLAAISVTTPNLGYQLVVSASGSLRIGSVAKATLYAGWTGAILSGDSGVVIKAGSPLRKIGRAHV